MFDQLTELEIVILRLEQITSLFNCMCRTYFEEAEPDKANLVMGYKEYTDIIEVIRNMVYNQKGNLAEATSHLYTISKELKKLAKQNMALLDGGASHD